MEDDLSDTLNELRALGYMMRLYECLVVKTLQEFWTVYPSDPNHCMELNQATDLTMYEESVLQEGMFSIN